MSIYISQNPINCIMGGYAINWSKEIVPQLKIHQINLDGKVLRATGKRVKKTAAICGTTSTSRQADIIINLHK
ncbi:MAG: hypothetical protein AAF573_10460 [Bacteroidota bacterium]